MLEEQKFVERRRYPRNPTTIECVVRTSLGARQRVEINDLSESGVSVRAGGVPFAQGSAYSVKLAGLETLEAYLCWKGTSDAGFEFERPLHPAVVDHLVRLHPPKED